VRGAVAPEITTRAARGGGLEGILAEAERGREYLRRYARWLRGEGPRPDWWTMDEREDPPTDEDLEVTPAPVAHAADASWPG